MNRWKHGALSRAAAVARNHKMLLRIGVFLTIAAVALIDRALTVNVGLGFLYLIAIVVCAFALSRFEIVIMALGCAVLREHYSPFAWQQGWMWRLESVAFTFGVTGLLVWEIEQRWRASEEFARNLAHESELRREAERQTRNVLETSPLAILAVESAGQILLANESARELFGSEEGLAGKDVTAFLPDVSALFDPAAWDGSRTMIETSGMRGGGQSFLAQVWCSATKTAAGSPHYTLVVWDATDSMRDREEAGLESFLAASRIVVGAVSHEIRNLSAAASVALANLGKDPGVGRQQDYQALVSLIQGLEAMAKSGLRTPNRTSTSASDLAGTLEELRIVIEPLAGDAGIALEWRIAPSLPRVRGDRVGLLRVFLNLTKNSIEAMSSYDGPRILRIEAVAPAAGVTVDIVDTGPGVSDPDALFRPFQEGATNSGLGLYVSRATVRSFGGELVCGNAPQGAWFQVKLLSMEERRAIA